MEHTIFINLESDKPVDYGFMQQRSFLDPDGHHWEIFFMDMDKFMAQAQYVWKKSVQ